MSYVNTLFQDPSNIDLSSILGVFGSEDTPNEYPTRNLLGAPYTRPADICAVSPKHFVVLPPGWNTEERDAALTRIRDYLKPSIAAAVPQPVAEATPARRSSKITEPNE